MKSNNQLEIKKQILIGKIIEIFNDKYDVEYYIPLKLIKVRKPMLVVDFLYLKKLVSNVDSSIEIRVNGNRGSMVYERF